MNLLKTISLNYQDYVDVIRHIGISQWDVE